MAGTAISHVKINAADEMMTRPPTTGSGGLGRHYILDSENANLFMQGQKISASLVGLMLTYLSLIRSLRPHPTMLLVKSILLLRHHNPLKARKQSIHTRQT